MILFCSKYIVSLTHHTHTLTHTQPPKVDEYYLGKVDKDGSTELGSDIESYKRGERFSKEVLNVLSL